MGLRWNIEKIQKKGTGESVRTLSKKIREARKELFNCYREYYEQFGSKADPKVTPNPAIEMFKEFKSTKEMLENIEELGRMRNACFILPKDTMWAEPQHMPTWMLDSNWEPKEGAFIFKDVSAVYSIPWLSNGLAKEAWKHMSAARLSTYGTALLEVAEDKRMENPDMLKSDMYKKLLRAGTWAIYWGNKGHSMYVTGFETT